VKHLLYRSVSAAHRALLRPAAGPGSRVLMYHSVGGAVPGNPYGISIAPELFRAHMQALKGLVHAPFGRPPAEGRVVSITFDVGFADTLTVAAPVLAALGLPFTVFVTAEHVRSPGSLYLSRAQLQELARVPGASIGGHGDRHVPLEELSERELADNLRSARAYLEDAVGKPVTSLSYPHGRVDRRVRDAAQAAGYALGGTSRYGLNPPDRDPLLLCRTEITAWDTVDDLLLKTEGHWDWFRLRHPDPSAKC
jgi:peptidoglycan/xylan/chitin deacetylase (PgdA/CDA1 family)